MSYYGSNPSYYSNYPPYGTYNNQFMSAPLIPLQQPNMVLQIPLQSINGKIVDGADMVRVAEVPIGSYGVFPKADLSEIYIKSWNNNGTTNIVTFKPVFPEPINQLKIDEDINSKILEKINSLEEKMNNLIQNNISYANLAIPQLQVVNAVAGVLPQDLTRKEVNLNAY